MLDAVYRTVKNRIEVKESRKPEVLNRIAWICKKFAAKSVLQIMAQLVPYKRVDPVRALNSMANILSQFLSPL